VQISDAQDGDTHERDHYISKDTEIITDTPSVLIVSWESFF